MWMYTLFQLSQPSFLTLWSVRLVVFILGWYFIRSLQGQPFLPALSYDDEFHDHIGTLGDALTKAFWRPLVTLFLTFASLQLQNGVIEQTQVNVWRWISIYLTLIAYGISAINFTEEDRDIWTRNWQ